MPRLYNCELSSSSSSEEDNLSLEPYLNLSLDWIWLDAVQKHLDITNQTVRWEDTSLSCSLLSETGSWNNRLEYIEKVVNDILENYPKDEELSIVSMGAGELLMEFIIGKALIEYGFQKISFFLIEPTHHYDNKETRETKKLLKDFRELISAVYEEKWKEPLPEERIHFLARSRDLENCIGSSSNVALLECLPPDDEVFNLRYKHKLPKSLDTFQFSAQVPFEQANSVAFIPTAITDHFKRESLQHGVPFIALKERKTKVEYGIDWGCKIRPDEFSSIEKYSISLYGAEKYFKEMIDFKTILRKKAKIKVKKGISNKNFRSFEKRFREENQIDKAVSNVKEKILNQIENKLEQQIDVFKKNDNFKKLTQEQTTVLLEIAIKEFANLINLNIDCKPFFLADYATDRDELVSYFVSRRAGSYAKHFTLEADKVNGYMIDVRAL